MSDSKTEIGSNFYHKHEGKGHNIVFLKENDGDKVIIPPDVLSSTTVNNNLVLIKQKANKKAYKQMIREELQYICRAFYYKQSKPKDSIPQAYLKAYRENMADSTFFKKLSLNTSQKNSRQDIEYFNHISDSILKADPKYKNVFSNDTNFWLINKSSKEVIGPLSKIEAKDRLKVQGLDKAL